jgi:hypothetical protein
MKSNGKPDLPQLIKKLSEPFSASVIRWRAGRVKKGEGMAQALPYVDARVYEDRLNQLCPGQWMVSFRPWGDKRLICELTIHGITRSSTGEEGSRPAGMAGTAAEAQAFKRACSKFGVGRHLYDLAAPWVRYDEESKKLRETPRLRLKGSAGRDHDAGQSMPGRGATTAHVEPTLSRERARKMHINLTRLGFVKYDEHYSLAEKVMGREVKSLTTLTESQARAVWNEAWREAHRRRKAARRRANNRHQGRAA